MKNWMLFLGLLISAPNLNACSWWPEGEYIRFSLFSSHLAEGDDAYQLFYSAELFNGYKANEYSGPAENLKEWHSYFGRKYKIEDIDEVIYRNTYHTRYSDEVEKRDSDLSKNPLMKHFKNGGHAEAYEYIEFAVMVEEQLRVDRWNKKEMDVLGVEKSIKFAEAKLETVKDETIKLRYAYQLVVMNHYMLMPNRVEYHYKNSVLKSPVESVLKSWAQFYYAEHLDADHRWYNFSRVFDDSKAKSRYIFQHFPGQKDDLKGVFKLCKNDSEKAAVLSLVAFKNPGRAFKQIKEISELEVNSELLDILMIREINKMEDWYLTNKYTSYGTSISSYWSDENMFDFVNEKNFQSDKKYLKAFRAFCVDLVKNNQIENKALWQTSIAYMAYILDDKSETAKYLDLARKNADLPEVKAQLAIIDLLHLVKYENDWGITFQENLMKGIKEVESYEEHIYRYDRFKSQLMLAISRKYLDMGELTLAALFESKVDGEVTWERYSGWSESGGYQAFDLLNETASSDDMDDFFGMWYKKDRTELEKWLCSELAKYRWRLTDLWATTYLREDKLSSALRIYKTIPDSVWHVDNWELHYHYANELRNDPFESNIYGRGYGANSGKKYTKIEFIEKIMRLKKKLDGTDKNKAHYALLLGNAYYNMSYNGNSYYYTEYSWSGYEADDYPRDQSEYYASSRALEYYELAEELAPNDKYAAFCYRMQIKCKRDSYHKDEDWKKKAIQDWKEFEQKYPTHAPKLRNCDHLIYYTDAWKEG